MNNHRLPVIALLLALAACGVFPGFSAGALTGTTSLPDAGTIIQRMIERAGNQITNQHATSLTFYTTNITEEFSGTGELKERTEMVKRVTLTPGSRKTELILYNGRKPTAEQLKAVESRNGRQQAKDEETGGRPDRSQQINGYVTPEVMARFKFDVVGLTEVDGRHCVMVRFQPAPEQPEADTIFERVINRMGGMFWIDVVDYEIARADIQLGEKVKLWGGVLGSLERISLQILRAPQPNGIWIDRTVKAHFVGRALTRQINIITWDHSSQPLPTPEAPHDSGVTPDEHDGAEEQPLVARE